MSSYTIGEVAERSGFSASALRYYEGIGLVAPATRSDAGYRLYDDRTLRRLRFIAGAKQLGCSLEEVTDLLALWDGEQCGPVQRRFHDLLTAKVAEAEHQMTELSTLSRQLRDAAALLAGPATDGPCGDECVCVTTRTGGGSSAGAVGSVEGDDATPIACTLDGDGLPHRLEAWRSLLEGAQARTAMPSGALRIEFEPRTDLGDLARLVAAEQSCCAFFSFTITVDKRGVGLEVGAPHDAAAIVASLFGSAA